jgi:hypothetical protein
LRDRRKTYLSRIDGTPSDAQLAMVQSMARLEWFALAAERGDDLVSFRESREHRRLLLKTMSDFEASLKAAVESAPAPRRPPAIATIVGSVIRGGKSR